MAKTSLIVKELQKIAAVNKYKARRDKLRAILNDKTSSLMEKLEAQFAMQKLPIRSCPCRVRRRCSLTGRPRGYIRRYGLARSMIRYYALKGDIPGMKLAS